MNCDNMCNNTFHEDKDINNHKSNNDVTKKMLNSNQKQNNLIYSLSSTHSLPLPHTLTHSPTLSSCCSDSSSRYLATGDSIIDPQNPSTPECARVIIWDTVTSTAVASIQIPLASATGILDLNILFLF